MATRHLQNYLDILETWLQEVENKVENHEKSKNILFATYLDQILLPAGSLVRYLRLHLDKRLTWDPHTIQKPTELNHRCRMLKKLIE